MASAPTLPPPGRALAKHYGLPLSQPPIDREWWSRTVGGAQGLPSTDEPKLLELVDASIQAQVIAPQLDAAVLRRALALPAPREESNEAIDRAVHSLVNPNLAAQRALRIWRELEAAMPASVTVPTIPSTCGARDLPWLLAEPAWVAATRALRKQLQAAPAEAAPAPNNGTVACWPSAQPADARQLFFSLGRALKHCRYLCAHQVDELVDFLGSEPARARAAVQHEVYARYAELSACAPDFAPPTLLERSAHLLCLEFSLCGFQPAERSAEQWTGQLPGMPMQRAESMQLVAVRHALREHDAAAAAAAAAAGPAPPLPVELAPAHGALARLLLGLDGLWRVTSVEVAAALARSAYAGLHALDVEAFPAPDANVTDVDFAWLLSQRAWREHLALSAAEAAAPGGHAQVAELLLRLRCALEQHAYACAYACDAHWLDAVRAGADLSAVLDGARTEVHRRVAALQAAAPAVVAAEHASLSPKRLLSALLEGAEGAEPWLDGPPRVDGGGSAAADPRVLPPLVRHWFEQVAAGEAGAHGGAAHACVLARLSELAVAVDACWRLRSMRSAAAAGDVSSGGKRRARRSAASDGGGAQLGGEGAAAGSSAVADVKLEPPAKKLRDAL